MTITDYAPQYGGLPLDTTFILYDFGLQVNYTVFYPIDHTPVMNESMIDSVLLNDGIYHQRYHFYETGAIEQVWLEGIGSENGIFGAFLPIAAYMNGSSWLECFKRGDTYVYGTDSCDFNLHETTAIHESTPETISCYVWENQIYIKNLPATMQARIYLFNVQGQCVFDSEIPDSKIISIPNLITGIYTAVIQVESGPTFSQQLKL
ncbi:MAG TPA: T9SS type A sorting domain-containing protein [Chitinophagales bacterium]|nr:T9SS type A sorting domain-containing protein [Chitinophagales bacterium]